MRTLIETFTKSWWNDFITTNKNFTETCVLKNCINENLLEDLNKGVIEVLRERFSLKDISDGFRVYLNGIKQDNDYLISLSKTPPFVGEDITEYAQRAFKKKFGMIINYGEKHSKIISKKIKKTIQPLLEIIGIPVSGFNVTIFISNYGWTPLGIHQDHADENVIHFHLGPGKKTMYTWDEKEYDKLTGSKHNNQEVESIIQYSKQFPFEKGDIYYMPWNKYHIGYSNELSVGVTLWFNNPTKEIFAKKILRSFVYQFVSEKDKEETKNIIPPELNYIDNKNSFNDLISTLKLDDEILKSSTEDFFKFIYSDFKYSIMSNGGWQSLSLSKSLKEGYDVNNLEYLLDKKIKSDINFKIYYYIKNENLFVFARGTKIKMRYHKELVSIINNINTHKERSIKNITKELSKEWPDRGGLILYIRII